MDFTIYSTLFCLCYQFPCRKEETKQEVFIKRSLILLPEWQILRFSHDCETSCGKLTAIRRQNGGQIAFINGDRDQVYSQSALKATAADQRAVQRLKDNKNNELNEHYDNHTLLCLVNLFLAFHKLNKNALLKQFQSRATFENPRANALCYAS